LFLSRLTAIIFFIVAFFIQNAFCAEIYKVNDLIIDSSDNLVFIKGIGNFKTMTQNATYIPMPSQNENSINLITDITSFKMTNPSRFVVDIPNAVLINSSRTHKIQNSSVLNTIQMSQFSTNPNIVRIVFNTKKEADLENFKVYTNGKDVVIKYKNQIVDNSIQYKFYTPTGVSEKESKLHNTSSILAYNNGEPPIQISPRFQTKYFLSSISQNSDGLILRGLGSISMQRANYTPDNTQATIILDNASMNSKLDNKTYEIPSTQKNVQATLTINKINSKKIKLTLNGDTLRDYRFVVSPDGQSLFISHRSYIINTIFSSNTAKIESYKMTKTSTSYQVFEMKFDSPVTYDVFEMNENFYLDVNNLGDLNETLFNQMLSTTDIKIQAFKISSDKTRYVIPMSELVFSYANVESNSKSIKLCFKDKPQEIVQNPTIEIIPQYNSNEVKVSTNTKEQNKIEGESTSGNINVIYVPKNEEIKETKPEKPKKKKENPQISALKKVVLDAGHGGIDSGAIGGELYEKEINLKVTLMVKEKLEKKDVQVYLTRKKDETVSLEDRVNYSNEINPDIFVSIHANSTVKEDSYGLETHYFKDDSLKLAKTIHEDFASNKNLKKWETIDRGVFKSRFYVINHTEAPSILIEIGFISNKDEREKLLTRNRQEDIAESIAKGILEYLNIKWQKNI